MISVDSVMFDYISSFYTFIFNRPCHCAPSPLQAECWLSSLESTMCSTVRKEIQEAVAAYEDKPRDQWLFDYPAQVRASHPLERASSLNVPPD